VLVGVNYRLGILGWLCLETAEAPGNLGLHDQLLALTWVRDTGHQHNRLPSGVSRLPHALACAGFLQGMWVQSAVGVLMGFC